MSNAIQLEPPLGVLFRKAKAKGLTTIVSSFQLFRDDRIESETKEKALAENHLIAQRFTTIQRLGSGGFGEVYSAKDHRDDDRLVAIKFERTETSRRQLPIEKVVFQTMSTSIYFPKMSFFGVHEEYTILAMDLLGPSVEDLLTFCGRKFSSKTIVMIIEQALNALEALHNRSLIHRDLKADNLLFGQAEKSHQLHLIDFGLCKNYRHPLTYEHSDYRTGKTLMGTARYCSLSTHHGLEQSRRDDIECLANILIYLAKGSLPWTSIKMSNRRKRNEKLTEMKATLTSKELCADLPEEFELFYQHARTLSFTQRPGYDYLRQLLLKVLDRSNEKFDYIYDWHKIVRIFKQNLDTGKPILPRIT